MEMEPTSSFCLCREKIEQPSHKAAFSKGYRKDGKKILVPLPTKGLGESFPVLGAAMGFMA